jgi:hypothetical protein
MSVSPTRVWPASVVETQPPGTERTCSLIVLSGRGAFAMENVRHTRGQRAVCTLTYWPGVNGRRCVGRSVSTAMSR